ncbi:MAG: hypothetical protein HFG28_12200 [Eubacterium sp.]|nr:hypothetical protein [Eubacterium sp.]
MKRKKIIYILGSCMIVFVLSAILYKTGTVRKFSAFLVDYMKYINMDMERQAKLLESIIGGICTGIVTFGALFVTILHENKKDRIFWEREREKEKEDRLLSVRPFLNVEVINVSSARTEKIHKDKDYVIIGEGSQFQYAHIILSNNGYGKCKGIELDGHKCSVYQLDVDDKRELDIYFMGIENDEVSFLLIFCYKDIFGNSYLQQFTSYLKSNSKELNIDIGKPLLKRGEE